MSGRIIPSKRVKKGEVMKATEEILSLVETNKDEDVNKSKIKADYLSPEGKPMKNPNVENSTTLRERILSLSLFPNVYNHKYLESNY